LFGNIVNNIVPLHIALTNVIIITVILFI